MNHKFFHQLSVVKIEKKTKECVAVTFEIPYDLKEKFLFKAGQYLTLQKEINGEDIRRSYSICSAPDESGITIAIKKLDHGKFSTWANTKLKAGDKLDVMPPSGNFIIPENPEPYEFVFFAAGSGITPVISQIKYILKKYPKAGVTLFFGNKKSESIIFREELEGLKNIYIQQLAVHHIFTKEKTGVPLLYGRIDKEKCILLSKHLFNAHPSYAFFICGPNDMIFDVKDALVEIGVPTSKIHMELFNTEGLRSTKEKSVSELTGTENSQLSEIAIQLDGDVFEFELEYGGQNLLDAALANGADLPYACKGGVCSTCKAKITNGEVVMDINYALEPYEVDAGFVLLCQSHPRSPNIYIDFDQK